MTNTPEGDANSRWLLEPPAPGEVQLHIAVGEDAQLTPQLRAALDQLVTALYGDEVTGYTTCYPKCPDLTGCGDFSCTDHFNCSVLSRQPCLIYQRCKIAFG